MEKVIKNDTEYESTLAEIEQLMELSPDEGTSDSDRLELLSLLVEDYESRAIDVGIPDPVDAIKFRMEQQELSQRDLVPFLGSRSKVSEILSRKRPLTLQMMKALHVGLGMPAKILLQGTTPDMEDEEIQWAKFPVKEMLKRDWFTGTTEDIRNNTEEVLREFLSVISPKISMGALYKQTDHTRSARPMDPYALIAWTARVIRLAEADPPSVSYEPGTVSEEFMTEVVKLSSSESGPLLAKEFLEDNGIALVIEPHLPRTHLDGAAILTEEGMPIVGLTLRHDRLDNFWFCLMHELAHIALHFNSETNRFYDDLDYEELDDPLEREADQLAGEALIPEAEWRGSAASKLGSPDAAIDLSKKLKIHPGIVAGRMRYEHKAYRMLSNLVGYGQVRKLFHNIKWGKS